MTIIKLERKRMVNQLADRDRELDDFKKRFEAQKQALETMKHQNEKGTIRMLILD